MSRILIAEDEPRICAFLAKGLKAYGFTTASVRDGSEAVAMACSGAFDLMLLDIGLPSKDGWVVLAEVREQVEDLPIIILTARDDVTDKVAGLEGGANDYITKPFRFEELLARVRLRLRDSYATNPGREAMELPQMQLQLDDSYATNPGREAMELRVGDLILNLRTHQVQVGDRVIELSTKEFVLAETFLRHPQQVLSREHLLRHVWGYNHDPGSNIVDVYVGYLRKKLGNKLIETVRGVGYRLRL